MEQCRACLATEHYMIPLDETFISSYNLLTGLNVTLQDGLPQYSCAFCAQVVKSYIEFREKSITSETTLWETAQDIKPKDENECEIELPIKQEVKEEEDDTITFDEFNEYEDDKDLLQFSLAKKSGAAKPRKHKNSTKIKINKRNKVKVMRNGKVLKPKKNDMGLEPKHILSCGICKTKFEEKEHLKSHLQMHMKNKECEICHEKFSAWPGLLSHRLEHIPDKPGHCHICDKQYKSSIYLEYHYITVHNDGQKIPLLLKCKNCQRSFKTPRKLNSHMRLSHGEKRFFCDYCSKGFSCKSTLRAHIPYHSENKNIFCNLCDYQCRSNQNLRAHKLRKHTPSKVSCKGCTAAFANQEKYELHKCKLLMDVACPICGKMIAPKSLTRHVRSHTDAHYKCTRCPVSYKSAEALRVHVDRYHEGVRRLQCEYCPAKFFSHPVLIKHRRTHTGEKPYVCHICSKGFTGNHNLKVHMKVHGMYLVSKKIDTENISEFNFKEQSVTTISVPK